MSLRCSALRVLLLVCALPARGVAADLPLAFVEAHFHASGSSDGLQGAFDSVVSPDGRHVYLAAKKDDAISEWSRDASTGALGYLGRVSWDGLAGGSIPNLNRPVTLALSPDGLHLYVGCTNSHSLVILARDPASGLLAYVDSVLDGADGASLEWPFGLAVSPDGAFVYAGDFRSVFDNGAVNVFARDASSGRLTHVQTLVHPPYDASVIDGLDRVRGIALSPGGDTLYTTSHGDNAVGVYTRDALTGMLSFVEVQRSGAGGVTGLGDPYAVAFSPDGAHVYVASHGFQHFDAMLPGSVDVFARNPATGALTIAYTYPEGGIGSVGEDDVAISPGGDRVYVSAQGQVSDSSYRGRLAVFSRDATTGALARLDVISDGVNGAEGLKSAMAVALSPDGQSVYVSSELAQPPLASQAESGALSVFLEQPYDPTPAPACNDGIDNDGDGLADYPADPGCTNPTDASEHDPSLACDDGIDNDGDGLVDYRADGSGDPGCLGPGPGSIENPACQNGIDDDGDGGIDFDGGAAANQGVPLGPPDPQCSKPFRTVETANHCGLGAELALAMPLLTWLHARRRNPRADGRPARSQAL
jgi:DNA-binding beta-propeller fold protein YncE